MEMETKPKKKTKKGKKGLWIALFAVLGIGILFAGYAGYRYLFPSDKDLVVLAHYNTIKDKSVQEEIPFFQKETDITCDLEGAFVEPKITENIESLSVHTEQTSLAEGDGVYRFAFRMGDRDMVSTERIHYGGFSYVCSDVLTDGVYYCDTDTNALWNLLFGKQGIRTDVDLMDGVDKETAFQYLKTYGVELYRALPDRAFTRKETAQGTEILLSGDAAWLLTDVVSKIKSDYALKNFLYEQWNRIVKNVHATYNGSVLLLPEVSQAEFESGYDEALQTFLHDMAEKKMKLEFVAVIDQNRRVISDGFRLMEGDTPVLEFLIDQNGGYRLVPYQEGKPSFALERIVNAEGSVTESKTTFSADVNSYSKSPSETEAKIFTLSIVSKKDTNTLSCKAEPPSECVMMTELEETEKNEIAETINQKLNELTTQLMFAVAVAY